MKKQSAHIKAREGPKFSLPKLKLSGDVGALDKKLLIRVVIATVIFAVTLLIGNMPAILRVLLLALCAIVAGYDIILNLLRAIEDKDYFATPVVVIVVAILSFAIGFASEGAALVVLYQNGSLLLTYAEDRTKKSAMELLRYQDVETVGKVAELLKDPKCGKMEIENVMRESATFILRLAMIFAVVYAIMLPLFTPYTFTVSIHRAITILLIATPMSVVTAMPYTGIMGLCYSAQQGVVYNNAAVLEKLGRTDTVIFDKAGIFSASDPRVLSLQSDVVDTGTFLDFAAHALYYSELPVAKAISGIYNKDYRLEYITDFAEIPGKGVRLKVSQVPLLLGTADVMKERGIALPQAEENGQTYYVALANRYFGKIVISSEINSELEGLTGALKGTGVKRCVLLAEESQEEALKAAEQLEFDEAYGECGTAKKLEIINDLVKSSRSRMLYVYSNGIEAHSAAEIDLRVNRKAKFADGIVLPEYVMNIPFSLQVSRRMRQIAAENAVFAFVIKAILIFLSIIGYCNVWFAVFIDMVAAIATILNTIRVTNESLIDTLKYKTGR